VPAKRATRTSPPIPGAAESRHASLRQLLEARRLELTTDVRGRMRERRIEGIAVSGDIVDDSDASVEEDLQLTLLDMRARTLINVDDAIARLEAGAYGICVECYEPIAESRLTAVPFAVRCRNCEDSRERHVSGRPSAGPTAQARRTVTT